MGFVVAGRSFLRLRKTFLITSRLTSKFTMEEHQVVPDVIDKAPVVTATIKYGSISLENGNVLTPTQVKDTPTTLSWSADPSSLYTLCMTDPDAPSRKEPTYREWHHWLVVNIPGEDVTKGETLSGYIGAGPPKGSGLHRYVYLIYKQPAKLDTSSLPKLTNTSGANREKFSIKKFAGEHKLGDPVAGNLFQAEWDDYVPILYKQLGE